MHQTSLMTLAKQLDNFGHTERLYAFLEKKSAEYNRWSFVERDPISVPHRFKAMPDVEIAGFFAAVFSWGQRSTIISKSNELMARMDNSPHQFCLHHTPADLKNLLGFKHRTFNDTDLLYFVSFLQLHYKNHDSLEYAFLKGMKPNDPDVENALIGFYEYFFSLADFPYRTCKHIASPSKKSCCKRLNMYLRWMVRKDKNAVDFGLWKHINPAQLVIPVDLHVARVARHFGLLQRKQTDWLAAIELTRVLKKMDNSDPVKYDFALFALGVMEKF